MTIALDSGTAAGSPAIKFANVGDNAVLGIANVEERQSRDFDSGDLLTWDDGTPRMHPVITAIVVTAQGGYTGSDDDPSGVQPGDVVTIHAEGGRWYAYRDARKEHGTVNVGDVMKWTFESEEPPKKRGHKPRKVYVAELRGPNASDGDLTDRCVALYHSLKERPAVDAAGGSTGSDPFGDEEPF
jgi:hypothetical protein